MSKIDVTYTPEEIHEFATRDMVISAQKYPFMETESSNDNFAGLGGFTMDGKYYAGVTIRMDNDMTRYANDGNRKIGLINGILDDGSFCISILGDGHIQLGYRFVNTRFSLDCTYDLTRVVDKYIIDTSDNQYIWVTLFNRKSANRNRASCMVNSTVGEYGINQSDAIMYQPQWQPASSVPAYVKSTMIEDFLRTYGKIGGTAIQAYNSNIQLTRSKDSSLRIGDLYAQYSFTNTNSVWCNNGYKNIGGALYAIGSDYATLCNSLNGYAIEHDPPTTFHMDLAEKTTGTYACHYIPFNLILTRNEQEALNYLDTGVLPSDAFIYPFDVDTIPTNSSGEDPGDDGGGGTPTSGVSPDEDGTPSDETDPMPTSTPEYSPLRLTNNNLYWLSAADLRQFINWFWTDATDVASLGDLWDKIQGLYENLSQAIINIRYMPVMSSWIGTLGTDTKIIVGMIEKEHAVNTIAKSSTPIRDIGNYKIEPKFKDSFCNYSPYSTISIYLPFHGMVELDNDLIMGHKIYIRCAYDILAGTIQYFIHRDSNEGSLIYSTVAKMAVDIPITLQTKTDRDSAIFQNVGSVVGGLVGAGASLAGGSPIGLTMGLANMSGFQPSSAPLRVTGNVSESGAFYAPTKCAIYIKRPAYNRPELYKSRVGFPCNYEYKLSECSGFTTCYKPRISFSGVTYSEDGQTVHIKPTHNEIEMIYDLLEKGVVI